LACHTLPFRCSGLGVLQPMLSVRMIGRSWLAAVVAALLLVPVAGLPPASAADASLTVTALRVLEQAYVEPVDPVQLLNAGIATMRAATKLGADALPDIAPGTPEVDAGTQFATEFSRAAQAVPAGASGTQLAYVATAGMLASLHDSHTYYLPPQAFRETQRQDHLPKGFLRDAVDLGRQRLSRLSRRTGRVEAVRPAGRGGRPAACQ
jgi:hypothetical protein